MIKRKILKSIFISLFSLFVMTFVGCEQILNPEISTQAASTTESSSSLASLNIKIANDSARTILPTFNKSRITKIALDGHFTNDSSITFSKEWATYKKFSADSTITDLKIGEWEFTISCAVDDVENAYSDTETLTVEEGANAIEFTLVENENGTGKISITLDYSSCANAEIVTSVDVYFYEYGSAANSPVAGTKNSNKVVFTNSDAAVKKGLYIIKFTLKDSTGKEITSVMELVRVAVGFTTEGTVTVSALSKSYTINYELDGGEWSGAFTAPVSFTNYDKVILPAASNILKEGYKFAGWYADSSFSGEAISSWEQGEKTEDVTLYAKWIFSSNVLYVNGATGDDDGEGSSTKPFKTVQKAIDKIKEISAEGENHIDGPYTINVTETIEAAESSSVADFAGLGEVNVTVDGDATASGTKANLKGNGDSVVFISASESNLTLILKNLIVTGGSAAMGGGVYASAGNITVENCEITGNTSTNGGGAIYLKGGTFTMTNGKISDNTATTNGGGVYVDGGTFEMEDGSISGNKSETHGGGVYVASNSTFTMSGGTISSNTATNNGGGVYVNNTFNISGAAQISSDNDVYLPSGKYITITGDLTGTTVATITPNSYTAGTQVLDLSAIEEASRADTCAKFELSDTTQGFEIQPDGTKGVLKKDVSGGITIDIPGSGTYEFKPTYGGTAVNDGDTLTYNSASSFAVTVTKDGNAITETPTIELRDTASNKIEPVPALAGTHQYQLYMQVEIGGVVVDKTIDINIAGS